MLLAKRCLKEHNIKNGSFLKLGTLNEYRKTESAQIADRKEGTFHFTINFEGIVTIDLKWFNTIFVGMQVGEISGLRWPGKNIRASYKRIQQLKTTETQITIKDSSGTIFREEFDSFVFCMSHIRKMKDCEDLFPGYNDQWYMTAAKAQDFGVAVGNLLCEKIKKEFRAGNYIIPEETDIENMFVLMRAEQVTYHPRRININNNNKIMLEDYIKAMRDIAFTKPLRFKKEKEFRFRFALISNEKIIEPKTKDIFLDASSLVEFLV